MKLDTVAARSKLEPRNGPYWHRVAQGQHLGFRVGVGGGTWFAKYRDPDTGKRHQTGLGEFSNLPASDRFDAAMKAAREWFTHLGHGGTVDTYTVKDACERYAADLERKKGTRAAADVRRRFAQYVYDTDLAKIELDRLKPVHVEAWRHHLQDLPTHRGEPRTASSLNRDMTCLRAALNLARRDQLIVSDTAWAGKLLPIKNADKRRELYLDREQRQTLIDAAQPDLAAFIRALCALPLRPGAMSALTVGNYDRRLKTINVPTDKSGEGRRIALPDATAALFDEAIRDKLPGALLFTRADGEQWIKDKWGCPFKAAAEAAGLPAGSTIYVLRHSVITDLVHAGVDLLTVAQISGTGLRMIEQNYGHLTGATAAAALAKVAL
jgi:site-specific recombinase XerD